MLIVTQSLQPSGMGVQDLEQGQLIIGTGQYGNFLYGKILGLSASQHWFPMSENYFKPVKPSSAIRLVRELDEWSRH